MSVNQLEALLKETEKAHGDWEKINLGGKRDENWARWYAVYIVEQINNRRL